VRVAVLGGTRRDRASARAALPVPGPPALALWRSVAWHLEHPPEDPSADFGDDDRALEAAV